MCTITCLKRRPRPVVAHAHAQHPIGVTQLDVDGSAGGVGSLVHVLDLHVHVRDDAPELVEVTFLGDHPCRHDVVREHLAAYKTPRDLVISPVNRAPNGKLDYKTVRAMALEALKAQASA